MQRDDIAAYLSFVDGAPAGYVVLADFSEAHVGPRNGEPVANGSRNSAYDMATAGPRLV